MNRCMCLMQLFLFVFLASCGSDGGGSSGPGPVPKPPRFTDNGDGTVTDNYTTLMWLKDPKSITGVYDLKSWIIALQISDIQYKTTGAWRLPNINELMSLINYEKFNPALSVGYPFVNILTTQGSYYWTSTTNKEIPSQTWCIDMYDGTKISVLKTSSGASIMLVKQPAASSESVAKTGQNKWYDEGSYQEQKPSDCNDYTGNFYCQQQDGVKQYGKDINTGTRYIDLGYGLKDTFNSIIWLKQPVKTTYTWELASEYCMEDIAGYTDWRMPTVYELESLLDASAFNPALPAGNKFKDILNSYYWSSTPQAGVSLNAWCVNMGNGAITPLAKTASYNIWPVRDILGE